MKISANQALSCANFSHFAAIHHQPGAPGSSQLTTDRQILLKKPPKPLTIHKNFDEI
ncbi:hypothetical protein [Advenella mimigardefordensis]|uniref:hypothetical protein n=1 Tax=Advenella mimigardefordensis TaxID=302406 RepID=UPI0004BB068D|nr:hypothetical protein [Advenella mimigardefordensis]